MCLLRGVCELAVPTDPDRPLPTVTPATWELSQGPCPRSSSRRSQTTHWSEPGVPSWPSKLQGHQLNLSRQKTRQTPAHAWQFVLACVLCSLQFTGKTLVVIGTLYSSQFWSFLIKNKNINKKLEDCAVPLSAFVQWSVDWVGGTWRVSRCRDDIGWWRGRSSLLGFSPRYFWVTDQVEMVGGTVSDPARVFS